jgi:UDP-N-acetylmuramoyl-tripeptide--D-alanyl-D-alanine ligase
MFTFHDAVAGFGDLLLTHDGAMPAIFRGAAVDSRRVLAGDLFFALRGERTDGHRFVADAVNAGATGIAVHDPTVVAPPHVARFVVADTLQALQALATYRRRCLPTMRVIGVTGSVGKTSTKEVIAHVLGRRFSVVKNEGSLNSESGLPMTLLAIDGVPEKAVLEMAMYVPGDIGLLCRIAAPEVGVVTNVGYSHLGRAGSLQAIIDAKAELPESLPPGGVAVLNWDDPNVRGMRARTKAQVVTFGLHPEADFWASDVRSYGLQGLSFVLHHRSGRVPVSTPLLGRQRLPNLLAAAAVAVSEGMTLAEVADALADARIEIRLQVRQGPNGATIIDDTYNASPTSVIGALDMLSELPGRRLALLGDMKELGAVEEAAHREVGRRAAQCCDLLVVVGDLGRILGEEAQNAGLGRVQWFESRERAVAFLRQELQPGDHLLVKASRAMELDLAVQDLINVKATP